MTHTWFHHHLDSTRTALSRLRRQPLASLFSILAIGIALSLPTSLYLLVSNLGRITSGLGAQTEMTAFLKTSVDATAAEPLLDHLRGIEGVATVRFVSREEGLRELHKAGLDEALTSLAENPLPNAVVVRPRSPDPAVLSRIEQALKARPEVDTLTRAGDWSKRLAAILGFATRLAWMLAAILGLALAVITGNTIRLQIYALREEIEVSRLIGATDRFIRRPFLHFGMWQGLLGGAAAGAIALAATAVLNLSIGDLAATYGSDFRLRSLGLAEMGGLLGGAAMLGLAGAWVSVNRTLRQFE